MNNAEREAEKAAIKQALLDNFEAENNRDIEGVLKCYHDDLICLPPGMPTREGIPFMRDATEEVVKSLVSTEHVVTHVGVSDSGDMGYAVANYRMVLDGPDGKIEDIGKFHCTMEKVDGQWKYKVLSWNNNSTE